MISAAVIVLRAMTTHTNLEVDVRTHRAYILVAHARVAVLLGVTRGPLDRVRFIDARVLVERAHLILIAAERLALLPGRTTRAGCNEPVPIVRRTYAVDAHAREALHPDVTWGTVLNLRLRMRSDAHRVEALLRKAVIVYLARAPVTDELWRTATRGAHTARAVRREALPV